MFKNTNVRYRSTDVGLSNNTGQSILPLLFGLFSLATLIASVRFHWMALLLAPPFVWFVAVPLWDKFSKDREFDPVPALSTRDAHYEVTLVALLSLFGLLLVGTTDTSSLLTMFGLGITGGLLVTVAWHGVQFCDESSLAGSFLRKILCVVALMPQLGVDSRGGHATEASTAKDFASARMGESYYGFVYRYLCGALARAWRTEQSRCADGSRVYALLGNEVLQILSMSILYVCLAWTFGGGGFVLLIVTQALIAIWQLTAAEYVEHYGMLRKRLRDGGQSPLQRKHVWGAAGAANNMLLSDRQFHELSRSNDDPNTLQTTQTPRIPIGYNLLTLLVLVPSFWFGFINEKLAVLVNYDLKEVNLDGDGYVALMERFHKPEG